MDLPDEILFHIFTYSLKYKRTTISVALSCTKFTDVIAQLLIKYHYDMLLFVPRDGEELPDISFMITLAKNTSAIAFVRKVVAIISSNICRGRKCENDKYACIIHTYCGSCNAVDTYDNMKLVKYSDNNVYLCSHCAAITCNICYVRDIQKAVGDLSICNRCLLGNSIKCIKCQSTSLPKILHKRSPDSNGCHYTQHVFGCAECNMSIMHEYDCYNYDLYY